MDQLLIHGVAYVGFHKCVIMSECAPSLSHASPQRLQKRPRRPEKPGHPPPPSLTNRGAVGDEAVLVAVVLLHPVLRSLHRLLHGARACKQRRLSATTKPRARGNIQKLSYHGHINELYVQNLVSRLITPLEGIAKCGIGYCRVGHGEDNSATALSEHWRCLVEGHHLHSQGHSARHRSLTAHGHL